MSITSGFFNSINGDRKYNAEDMSDLFEGILSDGILAKIGNKFALSTNGTRSILIGTGKAWFNNRWIQNDSTYPADLPLSELMLDRFDAVVIEINANENVRAGTIKVIKGTPSSTPQYPTLVHTEEINQYPLCYVSVKANSQVVVMADIIDKRGTTECPYSEGIVDDAIGDLRVDIGRPADLITGVKTNLVAAINWVRGIFYDHLNNISNPHQVTKAQVGLSNVDNTADENKIVGAARYGKVQNVDTGEWLPNGVQFLYKRSDNCVWLSDANGHASKTNNASNADNATNAGISNYGRVQNADTGAWLQKGFQFLLQNDGNVWLSDANGHPSKCNNANWSDYCHTALNINGGQMMGTLNMTGYPIDMSNGYIKGCASVRGYSGSALYLMTGNIVSITNLENNAHMDAWVNNLHYDGTLAHDSYRGVKENITDLSKEEANRLFDLKLHTFDFKGNYGGGKKNQHGLIVDEVENIYPQSIFIPEGWDENTFDPEKSNMEQFVPGVDYTYFIPLLLKQVQLLNDRITELEKQ